VAGSAGALWLLDGGLQPIPVLSVSGHPGADADSTPREAVEADQIDGRLTMIDRSSIRVQQHAAGAHKKGALPVNA
jgi:hypothetical protein